MPSSHGIFIEIIGDAKSYLRAAESTVAANTKLDSSFKQVGINANLSADAQVKAAVKAIQAQRAQLAAAEAALGKQTAGTDAFVAATVARDAAQAKLNRSLGLSTASTTRFSSATKTGERDLNKMVRGTLAGSGAVAGLGRSLAFASGGFLAFAIGATVVTRSITAAEGLEKAQASLDVAIQHTGGNLTKLRPQYEATAKAAAQFGITQTDATVGLARATVLAGNAAAAQRAYKEALVISKATGKDFNSTLTATAKGQEGITTSLRRYGILVEKTTPGTRQLAIVMQRFGGQAEANTTSLEKLHAQLTNALTTIGTGLLPIVNKVATAFGNWLQKMNDSGQLQADVAKGMRAIHTAATPLISAMNLLSGAIGGVNKAWNEFNSIGGGIQGRTLGRLAGFAKSGFATGLGDVFPGIGFLNNLRNVRDQRSPGVAINQSFLRGFTDILPSGAGGGGGGGASGPFGSAKPMAQYFKTFQLRFSLLLSQAQAQLTKGTADDVRVARQIVTDIKRKIDQGQLHGQALLQALALEASAVSTIQSAEAAAAQKSAAATQAAAAKIQAAIQNSIDPLNLEVALSRAQALGKPILEILRKMRSAARAALASGKLSLDQQKQAWDQITSLNQQIADELKKHKKKTQDAANAFKQASTRALTAGLDLSDAQRKALRERLSRLGPGGTVPGEGTGAFGQIIGDNGRPIHVHTDISIDGKKVAQSTTRHQQRHRRRNPPQRRGPHAGFAGG